MVRFEPDTLARGYNVTESLKLLLGRNGYRLVRDLLAIKFHTVNASRDPASNKRYLTSWPADPRARFNFPTNE